MAEAHARWVAAPGTLWRALLVSHSGLRMSAHMERGVRHAPRGPPPPGSLPASSRSPRAPWLCYPRDRGGSVSLPSSDLCQVQPSAVRLSDGSAHGAP